MQLPYFFRRACTARASGPCTPAVHAIYFFPMEQTTPIVAIVGRPNVGKSTLFNRLTKTRQALVDNLPGVTRDRLYGTVNYDGCQFTVIDTGGFNPPSDELFARQVHEQIDIALEEADAVIFLADGKHGLNPLDEEIAVRLRRTSKNKPLILAINKIDGPKQEDENLDFYQLAINPIHFVSAAHGYGIGDMLDELLSLLPPCRLQDEEQDNLDEEFRGPLRVSFLGRPNVGKSSLLNALTKSQRAVVSDVPGTTRDALDTPFTLNDREYLLIDTAGIRRKSRIDTRLERASIFRSLRAIERSHVVCVLLDASQPLADQDLRLIGQVVEAGRALLLVFNKMDLVKGDEQAQLRLKLEQERLQVVAPFAPIARISSLTGQGLDKIFNWVERIFAQYNSRIATSQLNQAFNQILEQHHPPMVKGLRPKFFYATQTGVRPPTIVVFVNNTEVIHLSYKRYLHNQLRQALSLSYAPLRVLYKARKKAKLAKKKK